MELRTIIVEDEPLSRLNLQNIVAGFFPQINIVATVATQQEAIAEIDQLRPDLIFLDIELQTGTGFGVIEEMNLQDVRIVFTTALDHYAVNLLRMSGVPYLQKPIDIEGLSGVLDYMDVIETADRHTALDHLKATLRNDFVPLHLLLPVGAGGQYVGLEDIIRIQSSPEGSRFVLKNGVLTVQKDLRECEELLSGFGFFRVHLEHVVNLAELRGMEGEGVRMSDGQRVPVSGKRVEELRRVM